MTYSREERRIMILNRKVARLEKVIRMIVDQYPDLMYKKAQYMEVLDKK